MVRRISMKKFIQLNNEDGASLAELLASIVILGILLTIVLSMFINSANVNRKSEELVDVTYIAQTELENLYAITTRTTLSTKEILNFKLEQQAAIESLGYANESHPVLNEMKFVKTTADAEIELILKDVSEINPSDPDYVVLPMSSAYVSVEAIPMGSNPIKNQEGQMELVISWEVAP